MHSLLRWIILILLVVSIVKAFMSKASNKEYTGADKKLFMFTVMAFHLQVLIGLGLYFSSDIVKSAFDMGGEMMGNSSMRFWAVEHIFGMVLSAVILTIGHAKSKRASQSMDKFKKIAVFYLITLIIVLATIPWPFRIEGIARPLFGV